jgi:hypothetical protein
VIEPFGGVSLQVSKEALDWATEVYREKHGLSPTESVAAHMNM